MATTMPMNGRFPTEPTIITLTLAVLLGLLVNDMTTDQIAGLAALAPLAVELARSRAANGNRDRQRP